MLEQTLLKSKELDEKNESKIGSIITLKLEGFDITLKASSNPQLGKKLLENFI